MSPPESMTLLFRLLARKPFDSANLRSEILKIVESFATLRSSILPLIAFRQRLLKSNSILVSGPVLSMSLNWPSFSVIWLIESEPLLFFSELSDDPSISRYHFRFIIPDESVISAKDGSVNST